MSRGVNKAVIIGFLGNDPEIRKTQTGATIVTISVATSESWTDKNSGQKQNKVEWHRVVAFNRLAEIIEQYLTKGAQVYIEGKIQTTKYQDKDGKDCYATQIAAKEMQMLGSRGDNAEPHAQPAQRDSGAPVIDFDDGSIPF